MLTRESTTALEAVRPRSLTTLKALNLVNPRAEPANPTLLNPNAPYHRTP